MKISTNNTKTIATIVMILLMASVIMMTDTTPTAKGGDVATSTAIVPAGQIAQDTIQCAMELSVNQRVVGQGQYVLVNAWLSPATTAQRAVKTYVFTITDPSGQNTTWNQDSENATAATWFTYTLTDLGTYTFSAYFTGCYFNGTSGNSSSLASAMYLPATSTPVNVTCQAELISSWPAAQIPTGYWTRPVDFGKREWWPILGNFPAFYDGTTDPDWTTRYPDTNPYYSAAYGFTPWVQSPHSSHIVWKQLDYATAGVTGGQMGIEGNTIASDLSTSTYLCNLVYAGRGYRTVSKPMPTVINGTTYLQPQNVWECFDLRSGEVFWDLQGMQIPTFIETSLSTTTAAISEGAVTATLDYLSAGSVNSTTGAITSPGRLVKYNPTTGAVSANISLNLGGTYTHYRNQFYLTVQNLGSINANAEGGQYRLINWTIAGTSTNFATRILSNTSYLSSSLPSVQDYESGYGASISGSTSSSGIMNSINVTGYNLYTGQKLWSNYYGNYTMFSGSCTIADHGKVATNLQAIEGQAGCYMAWDLKTGNIAWKSPTMESPWSATGFGSYGVASAYGLIIHNGYSGVTAINWTDGKIAWVYHKYALAPFESPYTDANGTEVYSFNSGGKIADGTYYTYNCEHTTTFPRTRGWSLCAVNMTDGSEEWSIALPGNAAFGNNPDIGAIADGYMTMESDLGWMVTYGIGQSATTITAPDVVVPEGTGVVIKGTVLDLSPAQPNTPCVSHDSMTLQMEYLHLQNPIGGIWNNETMTGVPVTLTAIDTNGNPTIIGTVTTNPYYGTFAYTWTPPRADSYTIIASFAGDDSYGSSSAGTDLTVGAAASVAPTTSPTTINFDTINNSLTTTVIAGVIAIIIAIAIVGLLILRKK